jgi:hypothetical protein
VLVLGSLGAFWERSLDVPWDNLRLGFFGNRLPAVWVCDSGHQHYSIPFWLGAVLVAIPTALLWLTGARPRRQVPPDEASRTPPSDRRPPVGRY